MNIHTTENYHVNFSNPAALTLQITPTSDIPLFFPEMNNQIYCPNPIETIIIDLVKEKNTSKSKGSFRIFN